MNGDKETKILKAAEKVFFKKGFFPTRMDDIAETAGVAKGTLYLYFKDKTSIYVHLMNHRLQEAVKLIQDIKDRPIPASEKLEKIFQAWEDYYAQAQGMTSFVSLENINLTQELMREIETQIKPKLTCMIDLITDIFRTGIADKEFKKVNPKIAAIFFASTVRAFFVAGFYQVKVKDSQKAIKNLFLNGVKLNYKES